MDHSFSQTFGKGGLIFPNTPPLNYQNSHIDNGKPNKTTKTDQKNNDQNQTLSQNSIQSSHLFESTKSIQQTQNEQKQQKNINQHSWFKKANGIYSRQRKQQIQQKIKNVDCINFRMNNLIKQIKLSQQNLKLRTNDQYFNHLYGNQYFINKNFKLIQRLSTNNQPKKKQISSSTSLNQKQKLYTISFPSTNLKSNLKLSQQNIIKQLNINKQKQIKNKNNQSKQLSWNKYQITQSNQKKIEQQIVKQQQSVYTQFTPTTHIPYHNLDYQNHQNVPKSNKYKYLSTNKPNTSQSHDISHQLHKKMKTSNYQNQHFQNKNKQSINNCNYYLDNKHYNDQNSSETNKISIYDQQDQFQSCFLSKNQHHFTDRLGDQYHHQLLLDKVYNIEHNQRFCQHGQSNTSLKQKKILNFNNILNRKQYQQKNQISKSMSNIKITGIGIQDRIKNISQKISQYQKKVQNLDINLKKQDKKNNYKRYLLSIDCHNLQLPQQNIKIKQKVNQFSQNKQNQFQKYLFQTLPFQNHQKQAQNPKQNDYMDQQQKTPLELQNKQKRHQNNKTQQNIPTISQQLIKQIELDQHFRKSKKQLSKLPQFIFQNNYHQTKWEYLQQYYQSFNHFSTLNNFQSLFNSSDQQADPFLSIIIEDFTNTQQIIKQCMLSYIKTQQFFNNNIIHNYKKNQLQHIFNFGNSKQYIKLDQFTIIISNYTKINYKCRDIYLLYKRIIENIYENQCIIINDGINVKQLIKLLMKNYNHKKQSNNVDDSYNTSQQYKQKQIKIMGQLNQTLKYNIKNCINKIDHNDIKKRQNCISRGKYR